MSHYCKFMTVRLIILVSVPFRCFDVNATEQSKCPRPLSSVFTNCTVDYKKMAMWCDSTNLKEVPHHKSSIIETQTPAKRAKRIYINESCVNNLNPAILGDYLHLILFSVNNNEVTRIGANTFVRNTNLQTLILSNNRIEFLHDKAFAGLKHLVRLDLKANRLSRVGRIHFQDTENLRTLDLSDNVISFIHAEAFLKLRHLTVLHLTGNKLHAISRFMLAGLTELRTLNVARNHLTKLDSGMFHSSTRISEVDFADNNISCIPRDLFKDRYNIHVFRINRNKLITPKPEWYRNVLSEQDRDLVGNNQLKTNLWSCGCDSYRYWYFLRIEVTDKGWKELLDVECSSPLNLRGKTLSTLGDKFFKNCTVSSKDINDCSGNNWNVHVTDPHPRVIKSKIVYATNDQRKRREEKPTLATTTTTATVPSTSSKTSKDALEISPERLHGKKSDINPSLGYQQSNEWIKIGFICGCAVVIVIIICGSTFCICKHIKKTEQGMTNGSAVHDKLKNNKQDIEESREILKRGKYGNRTSDASNLSLSIESDVRDLNPVVEEHDTLLTYPVSAHTTPKLVEDSAWVSTNRGSSFHANQALFVSEPSSRQMAPATGETSRYNHSDVMDTLPHDQVPTDFKPNGSNPAVPAREDVPVSRVRSTVAMGRDLPYFVHNNIATQ